MPDITSRQKAVLDFIADTIASQQCPPTIQEIGRHFGISSTNGVFDHLRTLERKGYIERSTKARSIRLTRKAAEVLAGSQERGLPLLGRVAAGHPLLALENIEEYIAVSPRLAQRNAFCLRVSGESMIDAGIFDGDVLVVDRDMAPVKGSVVVALIDDEATVKHFHPKSNVIELRPANKSMKPVCYPADQVSIQGVVVALQRSME